MIHIYFFPCQSAVPFLRRLFQTLTLKLQGQGHGCGQRARSYGQPSILSIRFLFISHQSDQKFLWYNYFENLTLKHPGSRSWMRSKVKVTYYTQYSTYALPFRFTSNQTNHIWDMAKIVSDLEKTHPKFLKKICQNKSLPQPWPWVKVIESHPVHFARPIYSLPQISKI